MSTEFVSQGVVGYICHDVKVISTNGFMDHTFCFATSETRAGCIDNIGVTQVAFERDVVLMLVLTYTSPFYKIFVYFFTDLTAALQRNHSESAGRDCF